MIPDPLRGTAEFYVPSVNLEIDKTLAAAGSELMPIYKQDAAGNFVPFEQTPFPDLEKTLEDWIEGNPHLLLEDEQIAIFARQPRTKFGKYLDLLGMDNTGATVIVELKRGETPRDVLAQALEYAAWIDSLTVDDLDSLAQAYCASRALDAASLVDVYQQAFSDDLSDDPVDTSDAARRVTFNNRQRIVIVAEHITDEVEQTLRYLRTRQSADVYGVEFSVHKAGADTIITTTTVVGREQRKKAATAQHGEGTIDTLRRTGRVHSGDALIFNRAKLPNVTTDLSSKQFHARFGIDLGATKNVIWDEDGQPYALSRLTANLRDHYGVPLPGSQLNGNLYWSLASDPDRSLFELAEEAGRQ